jgi:hypothetical protein
MNRRRWVSAAAALAAIGAAYTILAVLTAGPPAPALNPPGAFAFGTLGDAPYDQLEAWRYPLMLEDMNGHDLAFSVHVGDIFWRPCSEDRYERSLRWLNSLRHPLIYTPGDNEWTDCWTVQEGGYDPLDRLAVLRRIMFPQPAVSLGRRTLPLETQSANPAFGEFVEHARWSHGGVVFATIHVVGSGNASKGFPKRTRADDLEASRRLEASLVWLRESFAQARSQSATAVVVAFHADPGFDWKPEDRGPFKPLTDAFEREAAAFGKPVLLIHGDSHHYITDTPMPSSQVTRLEVPGSPDVGWVRVVVMPGTTPSFAFEPRVVPFWKYW